jgi:hypothetical protein
LLYGVKFILQYCVLKGGKPWPLTLRNEQRLKAFENGVMRRTFGCKVNEGIGKI